MHALYPLIVDEAGLRPFRSSVRRRDYCPHLHGRRANILKPRFFTRNRYIRNLGKLFKIEPFPPYSDIGETKVADETCLTAVL